tara:strand:- start:861 stop:1379 length:519 start_codon:yes stop_codon:yes gene_type:complete
MCVHKIFLRSYAKIKIMKRNNHKTGRPFKRGDKREDGFVFKEYYLGKMKQDGFFKEKWYSPESYFRICVRNKFRDSTRTRNRQPGFEKLENDLSTDYLISIFPENKKCPVFGLTMEFGGHHDNSPSLDRIDPAKGYTKNNVLWISYLANRMKSNLNLKELVQIRDWAKDTYD